MTAKGKRQVFVGQTGVRHHGAEVEIVTVPEGNPIEVYVRYPYSPSKRPAWIKIEDLSFSDSLSTSPNTSPVPELYPVGAVLTNAAGESVKVVDRFRQDVKLQLLSPNPSPTSGEGSSVGGALVTDFQPADDEPFTMSEQDVHEWLSKTLPSAAADTVPFTLYTWIPGQRARVLQNLPDDRWPLFEDDEGEVVESGGELGFKSDRYNATAKVRSLNGKTVRVLDYCEAVIVDSLTNPRPQPLPTGGEGDDERESDDSKDEQIKFLQKQIEGLLLDNKLLNREHDELMQAREDNGKLMAALEDAQRSIRQLEKKNNQQSEMLRDAVPQSVARPGPTAHLKTIMTSGGSNGFSNADIPHGYEIVSVTTEVYDGKLTRLIHLLGCGDSPAPREPLSEKATVELEKPQNSFEDLLRGDVPAEAVIEFANAEVLAAARQAAEARLNNFVQTEMPLLEGVK